MSVEQVIEAELTWTGVRFESGIQIVVDGNGVIAEVGGLNKTPSKRLPRRAILPGMINAHSHAFQRGLRGYGEHFPEGAGNFWTWREAMYGLVESLDEQRIYDLSKR